MDWKTQPCSDVQGLRPSTQANGQVSTVSCCTIIHYSKGVTRPSPTSVMWECVSHIKMRERNIFLKYNSNFPPCSLNITYISSQELNITIHVNGCQWLNKCLLEKYVKCHPMLQSGRVIAGGSQPSPAVMMLTHHPHSGGPTIPTASCWEQRVPTGFNGSTGTHIVPARSGELPFVFFLFLCRAEVQ